MVKRASTVLGGVKSGSDKRPNSRFAVCRRGHQRIISPTSQFPCFSPFQKRSAIAIQHPATLMLLCNLIKLDPPCFLLFALILRGRVVLIIMPDSSSFLFQGTPTAHGILIVNKATCIPFSAALLPVLTTTQICHFAPGSGPNLLMICSCTECYHSAAADELLYTNYETQAKANIFSVLLKYRLRKLHAQ
jgi:hypothetical protein